MACCLSTCLPSFLGGHTWLFGGFTDLAHFVTLSLTIILWGVYWSRTSQFQIPEAFNILLDSTSDARPFLTKAKEVRTCSYLSFWLERVPKDFMGLPCP